MKTMIAVAVLATLAILTLEISQGEARKRSNHCSDENKPPINTTEVTCDQRGSGGREAQRKLIKCELRCVHCYGRHNLQRKVACLVGGNCQCLAKSPGSTSTAAPGDPSTSEGPVETTTPAA